MNTKILSTLVIMNMVLPLSAFAGKGAANLAGEYYCSGFDSHDGVVNQKLIITADEKASLPDQHFGAYQFKGESYSGYIAAQGDAYGFYFQNNDKKAPLDYGVGIATITYDQDKNGKYQMTIHNSYYQPEYMRNEKGGRGNSTCTKL